MDPNSFNTSIEDCEKCWSTDSSIGAFDEIVIRLGRVGRSLSSTLRYFRRHTLKLNSFLDLLLECDRSLLAENEELGSKYESIVDSKRDILFVKSNYYYRSLLVFKGKKVIPN